ncbi:MAG TPA: ATP-binding protein [Solirubrobacteraceae bacterium]|jgi:two-component system sensor histidine kinase KdpD
MAALAALLAVLLAAAVLLALRGRARGREARTQAAEAAERAREATLVAAVARRLLHHGALAPQLGWIAARVAEALGAESARIVFASVPSARRGERVVRLPLESQTAWLYATGGADPARVAEPLASIMDVALERQRLDALEVRAQAALRGNLAKTAVLHVVAHDLRPLVHAVADAAAALPERDEQGLALRSAVVRAARLVDDLVDLSRLEAGTLRTSPDRIDLHEVVARAADHALAARGEHPIDVELPADLPDVTADRGQLERVFGNLLENAVRFSPPDAPVRVTGGAAGGRATVRVIDRGPGIPAGQRARVFEPFFQGRPSDEGGGLGLALSLGFVEANGGRLVLQSGADGETAFAVSLPLA